MWINVTIYCYCVKKLTVDQQRTEDLNLKIVNDSQKGFLQKNLPICATALCVMPMSSFFSVSSSYHVTLRSLSPLCLHLCSLICIDISTFVFCTVSQQCIVWAVFIKNGFSRIIYLADLIKSALSSVLFMHRNISFFSHAFLTQIWKYSVDTTL